MRRLGLDFPRPQCEGVIGGNAGITGNRQLTTVYPLKMV
jgi:hypothetical protein